MGKFRRCLLNSSGFSLMELILATGIIVVIFAGGVGLIGQMYSSVFKTQVRPYQLNQQSFDILQELAKSGYVNQAMRDDFNAESLSCLRLGTCKEKAGKWSDLILKRYNPKIGSRTLQIFSNSAKDLEEGMDLAFNVCKINQPDCLTRIVAQWTPLCGADAKCEKPDVQISIRIFRRQDRGWKELPEYAKASTLQLNVSEGKGACDAHGCVSSAILKKHCGEKSPSGFAADGSPICMDSVRLVPCAGDKKLLKLDADGQPVCVSPLKKKKA